MLDDIVAVIALIKGLLTFLAPYIICLLVV